MPSGLRIVGNSWHLEGSEDPPDDSVVGTPGRRPGSVRRTTHLQATWPDGFGTPARLVGGGRDLETTPSGAALIRGHARVRAVVDSAHTITSITAEPRRPGIADLIGTNAMRGFRSAVDAALPRERSDASALSFILDDVPAVTMVGGIAWAQHRPFEYPESRTDDGLAFQRTAGGRIACSGLRPGGYHEQSYDKGVTFPHHVRLAGSLDSDDPWAWHDIDRAPAVCFRRRRRLDAWIDGDIIAIDSHFRDSMWGPRHDEIALHEYTITATIDRATQALASIAVRSRVLPFPECPSAADHVTALLGRDVASLRPKVQDVLSELHACTHLNDMLRGLSIVPRLVGSIEVPG